MLWNIWDRIMTNSDSSFQFHGIRPTPDQNFKKNLILSPLKTKSGEWQSHSFLLDIFGFWCNNFFYQTQICPYYPDSGGSSTLLLPVGWVCSADGRGTPHHRGHLGAHTGQGLSGKYNQKSGSGLRWTSRKKKPNTDQTPMKITDLDQIWLVFLQYLII